ncbi:enhancer of polycomb homolog 2 [Trichonephila clavipes]|nr:enhancer of polycomb homolog 2 [Trichonephila clavipes]
MKITPLKVLRTRPCVFPLRFSLQKCPGTGFQKVSVGVGKRESLAHSVTVITLKEAKLLLRDDDDIIIAVYDYWLNKRLKTQHPLIPQVKTEKRDGSTNNNPYVAFRRRTEKMQTRKNRKNDEASYEKMLKLRRDLSRAVTLLELVKRREKTKRELLHLTVEVVEKRYQAQDFSGQLLAEVSAIKHQRQSFIPVNSQVVMKQETRPVKGAPAKKRQYKRKKPDNSAKSSMSNSHGLDLGMGDLASSEDDGLSLKMPEGSELANDAKIVANLALPPRFRQVLIESPL